VLPCVGYIENPLYRSGVALDHPDQCSVLPPQRLDLGLQLLERLTETADEGLLRTAWSHVYNCYTRKEISEAEYNALTRLKDVQKARFAPPAA
jgi:hypothetical protein